MRGSLGFRFVVPAAQGCTLALGLATSGCNWGRFTELRQDAPVERLEPPENYDEGFGASLAMALGENDAQLYVGTLAGLRGGLTYSLGLTEAPLDDPFDRGHCPTDDACASITQPVGLTRTWAPTESDPLETCFVSGLGSVNREGGLWTRCADATRFVFRVGADRYARLLDLEAPAAQIRLATNRATPQLLFASSQGLGEGWFYEPESRDPVFLDVPAEADDSLGEAVAVAAVASGFVLAWGAPQQNRVYLFGVEEGVASPWTCIEGPVGWGRTLASGDVDGDGDEDLVIADETGVTVFGSLPKLLEMDAEVCTAPDNLEVSPIARLECESAEELGECAGSDFGQALAVFDADGDGDGEIAVGAPDMRARGETRAGAVLIYSSTGEALPPLFASDADQADNFGSSLVAIPQNGREILAVGAEGARRVYLHYCAGEASSNESARCP